MPLPSIKPIFKRLLLVLVIIINIIIWLVLFVAVAVRVSPKARQLGNDMWIRYLVYSFDKAAEQSQQAALQDAIGGKTPEETIMLFIQAVEKGNYKLASKYFVIEKQIKWENTLRRISGNGKVEVFLSPLRSALHNNGYYSSNKNIFSIDDPIFVELYKYPSGNWKFLEI